MSSGNRIEFVEPAGLTDAEARRRQLAEEIGDIAAQLNARKQERNAKFVERHPNGIENPREITAEDRKENVDYHAWRKKALSALRARERVLRQLNDWLKAERRRLHLTENSPPEQRDVTTLISDAYKLFVKLREEDVEFEPAEWAIIEKLREHLDHRPKPKEVHTQ